MIIIDEFECDVDKKNNICLQTLNIYDYNISEDDIIYESKELYVYNVIPYFFMENIDIRNAKNEHIYCMSLLDDYCPDGFINIGIGERLKATADFKKMWTYLLMHQRKKFCLIHNHPNNSPAASQADLQSNQIASYLGSMMGLEFVEHIIITPSYYNLIVKGLQNGGEINEWAY